LGCVAINPFVQVAGGGSLRLISMHNSIDASMHNSSVHDIEFTGSEVRKV
jgi:hypothetical protein